MHPPTVETETGETIIQPSVLERVLKKLVDEARTSHGRLKTTSFLIIDAKSVKNTSSAWHKGYDAGKKVSGVKRHIAVDNQDLPHALLVTTANICDKAGAVQVLGKQKQQLRQVVNVLVDGDQQGKPFAEK